MPIRITDGIPITFPVSQADATFANAYGNAIKLFALDIKRSEQKAAAWCYAACAEMVINYSHNAPVTTPVANQCQVVSFVKKGKDELNFCCQTNGIECIARGCSTRDIGLIFDFWKVNHDTTGMADPEFGPVSVDKLRSELAAGNPVQIVVDWDDGGSHAVLVIAVQGNWLFIIDPLENNPYGGWHTVGSLQFGFSEGKWARTWVGLRRVI